MNVATLLGQRVSDALVAAGAVDAPPVVGPATRPEFGNYQANGVMGAAKRLGTNPRALAERVLAELDLDGIANRVEIAGPGFINIHLEPGFIAAQLDTEQPLLEPTTSPITVVVDYSAPNLAKEMHVGHLRSTIIGDAVARVFAILGHRVIRQNHVGDWGTQFGMLIAHLEEIGANSDQLADLEVFYQAAKVRFDDDQAFAQRARRQVVALQSGEPAVRAAWQRFIDISLNHCEAIYQRLGVQLTRADVRAESSYNDDLSQIVSQLDDAGLLTRSDGADCVFLDQFTGKDGLPLPVIVRKSDGAYLYATTDLAAARYRCQTLHADRVLYFVDARQSLHFQQVFAVAAKAGFVTESCELEHHPFGSMLGADGRPFRTRAGGVIKLADLLDEARQRAERVVRTKNPDLSEAQIETIAEAVGIGAVKYADLSKSRTTDYVFDWDQMLSFDGNTAPYLQYAHTRINSMFARGGLELGSLSGQATLGEPAERDLGALLIRFQEIVDQVARDAFPHHLCSYLVDVAARYMQFYESCPVLSQEEPIRTSRLLLSQRTADVLETGLGLLGIETVERM
jgi:arginyl-tRNA synthetase